MAEPRLKKSLATNDKKEALSMQRKARRSSDENHRFLFDVTTGNKKMKEKKTGKEVDDANRKLKKSKAWSSKDFGSGKNSEQWSRWGDDDDDENRWGDDWHGWSGKSSKSKAGKSDHCKVILTNLSFHQAFSELFVMTADEYVTKDRPVYVFGEPSPKPLAEIAQEAKADELFRYYQGRSGVEKVMIIDDFGKDDNFLAGGGIEKFWIDSSEAEYLTIVAGLPFTNDGAIVLEGAEIYDGAVYYLPGIDTGVESNVQTCWSVAANEYDFQRYAHRSSCADEDSKYSNDNLNDLPGEGFVMIHRGMQDLDAAKNVLDDFFFIPECNDVLNAGSFSRYFHRNGYDDDRLISYSNGDWRDDANFLNNLDTMQDDQYDTLLLNLARNSGDFDEFCDEIDDINKGFDDALTFLEAVIFDWRNDMAKVEIDCGGWESPNSGSWDVSW